MREWSCVDWPGKDKQDYDPLDRWHNRYQWLLDGEMKLDLIFALNPSYTASGPDFPDDPRKPFYEIARHFTHPNQVNPLMMLYPTEIETAMESFERNGRYFQVFELGTSLEEFEKFCGRYLPLPEGYKEAWINLSSNPEPKPK